MPVADNARRNSEREKKSQHFNKQTQPRERQKRVALTVPEVVDFNVELCALREGRIKNDVMVDALRTYLKTKEMNPDLFPTISYHS
jgi:hypothetical protein